MIKDELFRRLKLCYSGNKKAYDELVLFILNYKPKNEIKNNIFYPYSFTSKRLYQEMNERYERKFNVKFKG